MTALESNESAELEKRAVQLAHENMHKEHEQNLQNRGVIEKRKELAEALLLKKEKEEARERQVKIQQELEAERKRLEEESKKREMERLKMEHESIQRDEAKKLAASLIAKGAIAVKEEELSSLNTSALIEIQVEQLEKARTEMQTKLKAVDKRMDHSERAFRIEELTLLKQDYEEQKKADKASWEERRREAFETAQLKHKKELHLKQRMVAIQGEYDKFREQIESEQREKYNEMHQEVEQKKEAAKQARLDEYHSLVAEEQEKKRQEEEIERQRQEEIERKEREERERQEREEKEREDREKEEREKQRKFDEQMQKQRERERLAEEKIARSKVVPAWRKEEETTTTTNTERRRLNLTPRTVPKEEESMGRRRLNLAPRTIPKDESNASPTATRVASPNVTRVASPTVARNVTPTVTRIVTPVGTPTNTRVTTPVPEKKVEEEEGFTVVKRKGRKK